MRIKELDILRYIEKRKAVTEKKLLKKFPDLYVYLKSLKEGMYINEDYAGNQFNKFFLKIKHLSEEDTVLILCFNGLDEILKNRKETRRFIIPYIITTGIAVSSIIIQFLNFGYDHPDFVAKISNFFIDILQWFRHLIPF